jgi:HK97 family phage major capsid protein
MESPNSMISRETAEGATIPLSKYILTSTNIKPVKYSIGLRITRELKEDAKWPMLANAVRMAGKRMAERETKEFITILDGAANTVSGGAAATIANINSALGYVEDSDYEGTSLLVGNEFLQDLRNIDTFFEADKLGNRDMIEKGFVGRILGMNVLRFSTNAAPSSTYAKYAYVYDRGQAVALAEKRPLTVEQFEIGEADMTGVSVTQRFKFALLRSSSVAKITTS